MKYWMSFWFILCLVSNAAVAQQFTYDIRALGSSTGEMKLSKSSTNGVEKYNMNSNAYTNYLLGEIKVDHTTSIVMKDGKLVSGYCRTNKNGDVEQFCSIDFDGTKYTITTERGKTTLTKPITYCIVSLYYKEPIGLSELFCEGWGQFVPITSPKPHVYVVKMPDGKKNTYHYENGVMVDLEVPSIVGAVHLRLKK